MNNQKTTQAVVTSQAGGAPVNHQTLERFALYLDDGSGLTDVIADLIARVETLESA